jgi:hypothetical protein
MRMTVENMIVKVGLFLLVLLFGSCVRNEVLRPEYLLQDKTKDIVVYTLDERVIKFKSNDYKIVGDLQSERIQGRSLLRNRRTGEFDIPLEANIALSQIEKIVFQERTMLGTIGEVLFVGIFAVFLIFFLFFGNLRLNVG